MKLASALIGGRACYGLVEGEELVLPDAGFAARHPGLRAVLAADALVGLASACVGGARHPVAGLTLLPPILDSARVICVGINFAKKYLLDQSVMRPEHIILFVRLPGTRVGHGSGLGVPRGQAAETFDYEGEVALVIGKGGRDIAPPAAHRHIAGYTLFNDGSVRGWQKHSVHAGKNFANSGAMGPWIVTAKTIDAPETLEIRTRLNGQIVQQAPLSAMFFSIPQIIAYVSAMLPLLPGDVIATGCPTGRAAAALRHGSCARGMWSRFRSRVSERSRTGWPMRQAPPHRADIKAALRFRAISRKVRMMWFWQAHTAVTVEHLFTPIRRLQADHPANGFARSSNCLQVISGTAILPPEVARCSRSRSPGISIRAKPGAGGQSRCSARMD